jgi:hypothetical protein
MGNLLSTVLGLLNFMPGLKRKLAAVAALALAVIAAWNSAAPELGVDFIVKVPEIVNAAVLALLGVGVANAELNAPPKQ